MSSPQANPEEAVSGNGTENAQPRGSVAPLAVAWTLAAIISLAMVVLTVWLLTTQELRTIPFDTDEADHANAGLELYAAIRNADGGGTWRAITRQAFYPPVHSLPVAMSYFALGPSHFASRLPSILLLGVVVLSVGIFATRLQSRLLLDRATSVSVGALAAALALTAQGLVVNAHLCMLELVGAAVIAGLLLAAQSREDDPLTRRSAVILGLAGLLVLMTKYNFGMAACPAVVLAMLSARGAALRARLVAAGWFSGVVLVPLGLWVLVSDPRAALNFLTGHAANHPLLSVEHFLYYPKAWLSHYAVHPFLSGLTALLAVVGAMWGWRFFATRVAVFSALLTLAMLLASATVEIRYLIPAAIAIWPLAAIGLARLLMRVSPARRPLAFAAAVVVVAVAGRGDALALPGQWFRELEGLPEHGQLQAFIAEQVDAQVPVLVIGTTDQFSLESIRWHTAVAGRLPYTGVRVDGYPISDEELRRQRLRKRNMNATLTDARIPRRPLGAILETDHYRFVAYVSYRSAARNDQALDAEVAQHLASPPTAEMTAGDRRVRIFELPPSK